MPSTDVVIFKELDGSIPLIEWMDGLLPKVQDKLLARIELLKEKGYELRRPHADLLRDGIHELRAKHFTVNYRILYFFHRKTAVLSHGLTKEGAVPDSEIDIAMARHKNFAKDPEGHTHREK
jgi:hypothetical protein